MFTITVILVIITGVTAATIVITSRNVTRLNVMRVAIVLIITRRMATTSIIL